MKGIKKITDCNKALLAFGMVLFFAAAALLKVHSRHAAFHASAAGDSKKEKQLLSVVSDNSVNLAFEKFSDNTDSDDPGIAFVNSRFSFFSHAFSAGRMFIMPRKHSGTAKLPLYDLYCDWKSDLF